ncbi:c-type cytochrome [Deinococcus radiophilus]
MYALAMTALLLLGIGGSVVGYRTAVNKVAAHEAHAEAGASEDHGAAGEGEAAEGTGEETETPVPGEGEPDTAAPEDGTQQDQLSESEQADAEAADAATDTQQDTEEANASVAAATTGDPATGQEIFASSCGGCHGAQGQGGLGPAMTENATSWSQPEFVQTLREGNSPRGELAGTMPRFSQEQLSDDDLNHIYAWVQSLN